MSTIIRHIKKGFKDGIKSIAIDLDPPPRDMPKGGIHRHWDAVGSYMRNSMTELKNSRDYQDKCDAHYIKSNEQKQEKELERA